MIADLKPYAEYKESGLPWLGQVPGHWELKRTKSSVANIVEQTSQMNSDDIYVALENIESWTGHVRPQQGEHLFTGQVKRFRRNDVLFGKLRPYLAKVTRLQSEGVCVGELFVLRPRDGSICSEFLEQQLRAKHTIDIVNSSTFGAKMPRADWQFVGNLSLVFPPSDEQAAIVRFLDWANGRLERAIRAKRKVIALLGEQKQAIIHRAVTRGLDPSVPLKPSGIPWLGDIPQHWEVVALGRLCVSRCDGPFGSGLKSAHYTDSGVRVIRLQNIGSGEYRARDGAFISAEHYATLGDHGVIEGDLLVAGLGDEKIPAGRACVAPRDLGPSMVKADCFRFRMIGGQVVVQFIAAQLSATAAGATACLSTGATRLRINLSASAARSVAIPPAAEQQEILTSIDRAVAPLIRTISRLEREIELLREYRTRLVADLVTGKLDVRQASAHLPDEALPEMTEDDTDLADEAVAPEEEAIV